MSNKAVSINFTNFSITRSGKGQPGGKVVNSAETLGKIATLTQLNKLAELYLGAKFEAGTPKLQACQKLMDAMEIKAYGEVSPSKIPTPPPVAKNAMAKDDSKAEEEDNDDEEDSEDEVATHVIPVAAKNKKSTPLPVAKKGTKAPAPLPVAKKSTPLPVAKKSTPLPVAKVAKAEKAERADREYVLNGKVKIDKENDHAVLRDMKMAIISLSKIAPTATAERIVDVAKTMGNYDWLKVGQSNKGVFSWWSRFLKSENAIIVNK
jgi:hypothetical protein